MNNENVNFVEFIKKYNIKIPIIQRDYVQGKDEYIRENFVEDIFDSLQTSEKLNLEFIYGSTYKDDNNNEIFEPIDGQQRLTTLYLVTLFLALKENEKSEIEKIKGITYEVRNSSKEFCDELKTKLTYIPKNVKIKEYIINQKWYDEDWKNDQTIESMLEMLQTIQDKYDKMPQEELYYNKLEKYINFKFINTQDQELDENTYIKLNARGIKLSVYEKYKASFLEYDKFRDIYSKKIDNTWNEWIWKKINIDDYRKDNSIFDNAFVGIFRAILTNEYANQHRIINYKTDSANEILNDLINKESIEFSRFKKLMDNDMEEILLNIGKIFDFFINTNIENSKGKLAKYIDSNELVNKQLINVKNKIQDENKKVSKSENNRLKGNKERCEFYAICLYAIQNYNNEFNEENYYQWTRIARNLIPRVISSNAEYTIIINNLFKLFNLIKKSENYLLTFSNLNIEILDDDTVTDIIFKQKTQAEILKAKTMLINKEWKKLIEENDENKFLAGETNFLLEFCGIIRKIKNEEIYDAESCLKKYREYTMIKNIIFPKDEEKICEDLDKSFENGDDTFDNTHKILTRALLAISEWNKDRMCGLDEEEKEMINQENGYLIKMNNLHYTFLCNSDDRDYSWRNIFKEENRTNCLYFKILMNDMIKEKVDTKQKMINRLNQIIKNSNVQNWKKYFIDSDEIYCLMNNRLNLIKIESFEKNKYNIFLLKGKADSSKSLPLFFIALDEKSKKYNLDITSKGVPLKEAYTTGLWYNLETKKKIDRINDKECLICMKRDKSTGNISYNKNISNLDEIEKQEVNKMLSEIEQEFKIEFLEV